MKLQQLKGLIMTQIIFFQKSCTAVFRQGSQNEFCEFYQIDTMNFSAFLLEVTRGGKIL